MPRRLEVFGGVAVRRIVAAPDVATRPNSRSATQTVP